MKKIKIFLGGYVNYLNAQNINCRALSQYLNKDKFDVSTMLYPVQNAADFEKVNGVKYIQLYRPVRFLIYLAYLRGIATADVAYLPKAEIVVFTRFIAKLFRTKIFTTLEGLINETDLSKFPTDKQRQRYLRFFSECEPNLYSITKFLVNDVGQRRGFHFAKEILYLGVDSSRFLNENKQSNGLRNVCFIGNMLLTKNIHDFLGLARTFPSVKFHIIGAREMGDIMVDDYINQHNLSNVTYHGRLDHTQMSELLQNMDLMYFPSRSEGFPKVHLETACAGVPTMCYPDYGAAEWIDSWKNGIIVNDKEEAAEAIRKLIDNPDVLKQMSRNAVELGKSFDWQKLVGTWEKVIEKIYNE